MKRPWLASLTGLIQVRSLAGHIVAGTARSDEEAEFACIIQQLTADERASAEHP